MRNQTNPWARNAALILAGFSYAGCSGNDDGVAIADATVGAGGSGGAAGASAAAGAGGAGGGTSGAGGVSDTCTGPAPTSPVVCGGQTCSAPTFEMNPCVVPCCIDVGGVAMCGAKSTSATYPAECTLPAVPDPSCPTVSAPIDAQGTIRMFEGCCNAAQGKCGVVGWTRPGCITHSTFVTLPDPPMSCEGSADAGAEDAALEAVQWYYDAFSTKSFEGAEEFMTEDFDNINPSGDWTRSRETALSEYTSLLSSVLSDVTFTHDETLIWFAADDFAFAATTAHLSSYVALDGTEHENDSNRVSIVLVKRGGRWRLMHVQNTPL